MNTAEERRVFWLNRLAGLSEVQRGSLARALAQEIKTPGRQQLIAYIAATGEPPTAAELGALLEDQLPEYMIPSRYILLERLPRTASGKLDRHGLNAGTGTDLGTTHPTGIVAPRNEAEVRLADIWRDLLEIDEVSVHDDFFEIGGDSLLSIRVISRAGRAGIRINPESFFAGPTIAALAASGGNDAPPSEQGVVVGKAALTPIQEWFFERIMHGQDHWNQSVLLDAPAGADRKTLERVIAALITHHDALRLRFVRNAGGWRQEFCDVPAVLPIRSIDLSDTPFQEYAACIVAEANTEHQSLDLENSSLFRVVLFDDQEGFRRVLLLAHHLLVDGLSWRILLDDISTLLAQSSGQSPLRLPRKTASAAAWAKGLVTMANEPETTSTNSYWMDTDVQASWVTTPHDTEAEPDENRMGNAVTHTLSLSALETNAFLENTTRQLNATVQELLVAALLLGWARWTGRFGLQLDVEGHGRDVLGDRLDVSRTVGWFTTVFPVQLDLAEGTTEAALQCARTALRELPMRGAAYGLLRYLHPDGNLRRALGERPRSELLFNYLGSLDALLPPDSPFEWAPERTGQQRSPDAPRAYRIEINARVENRCLTLDIEYSSAFHHAASIARFADAISIEIAAMSVQPSEPTAPFELANLDEAGLNRVADLLAEIDDE